MTFALPQPFFPMEALSADEIPTGPEWQYEPKWDGFRCIVFRDGDELELQSKAGQTLTRYFPELAAALLALKPKQFVLDGEIVVPVDGNLAFDQLLQRIHPAESRVRKLAAEHPSLLLAFDLLADDKGKPLIERPLEARRERLEKFASAFEGNAAARLSPATRNFNEARRWFRTMGGGLDGIIAKDATSAYLSGERTAAMQKIKNLRTAECVVGGFRYGANSKAVGSLLLGLYDDEGLLHHVGYTSSIHANEKAALTKQLEKLIEKPGFTGRAPGGPSRWSRGKETAWEPLRPELVAEVQYDHYAGGRFRHGTKLLRWRPDKAPEQCTLAQVEHESKSSLALL